MPVNRITGMVSGMDTDKVVKDLMKIEQMRIDKLEKEKTRTEWKQEAYRDVMGKMTDFQSKYFDVLKPKSNFKTGSAFSSFSESVTLAGMSTSAISVKGSPGMSSFKHSIQKIEQVATSDSWRSNSVGLSKIASKELFSGGAIPAQMTFNLAIDGTSKKINLDTSGITDANQLASALDAKVQDAFGTDYAGVVKANADGGIDFRKSGSKLTILPSSESLETMEFLGIESGSTTYDYKIKNLNQLFGISTADMANMKVNGVSLTDMGLNQDSSIEQLNNAMTNFGKAGVKFGYDSSSDTFSISADKTGTANKVEMSDEFKNAFGFGTGAVHSEAQNAILTIDGTRIVKESNNFKLDGVSYQVNDVYDGSRGEIKVNVNKNTDEIKKQILSFVEDYNKMVGDIKSQLRQKRAYSFNPLTKEEKEAMTDDEIEKWEKKAKAGLIRNDRTIENTLSRMSDALYGAVEGTNLRIFDIGIQTSSDVKGKAGQLVVNDERLSKALEENYDQVVKLFSSESDKSYKDVDNRSERYRETGIAGRINDILNDAVRTTRDSKGRKGALVEKAGVKNTSSDVTNELAKQMRDQKERISKMWQSYYKKEAQYYTMFSKMETALKQMENQGMSFMSQMGM